MDQGYSRRKSWGELLSWIASHQIYDPYKPKQTLLTLCLACSLSGGTGLAVLWSQTASLSTQPSIAFCAVCATFPIVKWRGNTIRLPRLLLKPIWGDGLSPRNYCWKTWKIVASTCKFLLFLLKWIMRQTVQPCYVDSIKSLGIQASTTPSIWP